MSNNTPEWVKRAKVGDKVVCTKLVRKHPEDQWATTPIIGTQYTIRDILIEELKGRVCFRLAEIKNPGFTKGLFKPFPDGSREPVFLAVGFRPVSKRSTQTGMSILRKIADGQRQPERV